ncbi:hypothetical protein [Baekduia sp. Peel2402]|uniref:hypothetical protein n=1 Tax=Baekduia sp. Peel2402 TaxID=3458296 RepID=UPI00403E8B35
MSRISRLVVLVTALASLMGLVSATAGAVTWHNTGNSAFTATGGPATLSVGSNNLACSASSATGTAPLGSFGLTVYSATGTITFSPCTVSGQSTYVDCGYRTTGFSFAAPVTSGNADVNCVARLTASNTALCNITGTTPGQYTNPSGTSKGKATGLTSGTGLTVSHSSGTSCLLGTGPAHLSEQTITITSASGGTGTGGPVLDRTA